MSSEFSLMSVFLLVKVLKVRDILKMVKLIGISPFRHYGSYAYAGVVLKVLGFMHFTIKGSLPVEWMGHNRMTCPRALKK